MKIGEYARTPNGVITKIIGIQDEENQYFINNNAVSLKSKTYIADKNITIGENFKHSPNIIDLIEVGDYVNGVCVTEIKDGKPFIEDYNDSYYSYYFDINDIYSIVTKEDFERMEYKVGD